MFDTQIFEYYTDMHTRGRLKFEISSKRFWRVIRTDRGPSKRYKFHIVE